MTVQRSTIRVIILGLIIVLLMLGTSRVVTTTGGTRNAARCNSQTMLRLAQGVVQIANAFAAPPAPNPDRQKAVDMIIEAADAMARQAVKCAD